ncbi:hypothetical protein [Escherichia coli]|nr:hypothetical protein [Escherichia coli]WHF91167.1 hypothetical protein QDX15_26780 [Escherichia coli]
MMEKQVAKNNNSLKQHVFNMLSAGSELKEVKRFLTSKRLKARPALMNPLMIFIKIIKLR